MPSYFFDSRKFEGSLVNDKPHGYGICFYIGGGIYEGQWENGMRSGHGVYTAPDLSRYEGEWKLDLEEGFGVHSGYDGSLYEGQWSSGQRVGWGDQINAFGSKFSGKFRNDTAHVESPSFASDRDDILNKAIAAQRQANLARFLASSAQSEYYQKRFEVAKERMSDTASADVQAKHDSDVAKIQENELKYKEKAAEDEVIWTEHIWNQADEVKEIKHQAVALKEAEKWRPLYERSKADADEVNILLVLLKEEIQEKEYFLYEKKRALEGHTVSRDWTGRKRGGNFFNWLRRRGGDRRMAEAATVPDAVTRSDRLLEIEPKKGSWGGKVTAFRRRVMKSSSNPQSQQQQQIGSQHEHQPGRSAEMRNSARQLQRSNGITQGKRDGGIVVAAVDASNAAALVEAKPKHKTSKEKKRRGHQEKDESGRLVDVLMGSRDKKNSANGIRSLAGAKKCVRRFGDDTDVFGEGDDAPRFGVSAVVRSSEESVEDDESCEDGGSEEGGEPEWQECYDQQYKQMYYFHHGRSESQWERPAPGTPVTPFQPPLSNSESTASSNWLYPNAFA